MFVDLDVLPQLGKLLSVKDQDESVVELGLRAISVLVDTGESLIVTVILFYSVSIRTCTIVVFIVKNKFSKLMCLPSHSGFYKYTYPTVLCVCV